MRSGNPDAEPELRAWMIEDRKDFRRRHVGILLDPEHPDWAETAWEQLSRSVRALEAGRPYRFPRWRLPDNHSACDVGSIHDELELGADDVLRVVVRDQDRVAPTPPYQADRERGVERL